MIVFQILSQLLWQWILPPLLGVTALCWAVRLHGRPVIGFGKILLRIGKTLFCRGASRKQKQVFASALAATMGTGNLVGAALAVMTGGAGAIFWMWVSALLGMVLVYAENLLGYRFRRMMPDGTFRGGALALLHDGLGQRIPAVLFAGCCVVAGLGMGNMTQSGTIAGTAEVFGISRTAAGITTALLLLLLLSGRGSRAVGFLSVLMPLLCAFYCFGCLILLIGHADAIPAAFSRIMREAIGIRSAARGFSASVLLRGMSVGLRRGIFSNEAGLGTSGMLHTETEISDGLHPADWAAVEVFADTVICCTATALVVLTAPSCPEQDPSSVLLAAFRTGLGTFAEYFLAISLVLFALATAIGWFPCGAAAFRYLFGSGSEKYYLAMWVLIGFAGALSRPDAVWAFSDCCNAFMALPNLYAMIRLPAADESNVSQ
ncbi:MAG: amino acid carrier protein [Oscillospiraceae bacterium]|nr:amino acid carrier protein [Oscillospiraceae bacterium]